MTREPGTSCGFLMDPAKKMQSSTEENTGSNKVQLQKKFSQHIN